MNIVEPIRSIADIVAVKNYLRGKSFRNFVLFTFGINTGLRISDILKLNVADVKNRSYIELTEKKTGKFKQFPLNKNLKVFLKKLIEDREDAEPLFISQKRHRLHQSQVYRMLNETCTAVGVQEKNIGTHTMRKTFGYHHYKKFKDIAILQEIFNHSSPQITMRYIGINQDEINQSYRNFEL